MKDLLQKAFEYGQKFEGRGGDENYSFEQFLADNNHALQLQQTDVISSACNDYIEGINMQCARCDEPKYKHRF